MGHGGSDFVPFAERPEWTDVTPIAQDDGPSPVCPIAYTEQFRDVMDYFRAIIHKDERSERAFRLTTEVLSHNPANYTAWTFRRVLLHDLQKDLQEEMQYTRDMARENQKNYQIWYHRRILCERLQDASQELDFTAEMLDLDAKNYHAWAHRQWAIKEFGLWDEELVYIDLLLRQDIRNNSVWNQRFFVVSHTESWKPEVREREMNYALSAIQKAPNNQSPWNYLRGVLRGEKYSSFPSLKPKMLEYAQKYPTCPHVLAFLVDLYRQEKTSSSLEEAAKLCDTLSEKLDEIHVHYWKYLKGVVSKEKATLAA